MAIGNSHEDPRGEARITPLMLGIVEEAHALLSKEIELAVAELRHELRVIQRQVAQRALGALFGVMCIVFLAISTVRLLESELGTREWVAYAVVGMLTAFLAWLAFQADATGNEKDTPTETERRGGHGTIS